MKIALFAGAMLVGIPLAFAQECPNDQTDVGLKRLTALVDQLPLASRGESQIPGEIQNLLDKNKEVLGIPEPTKNLHFLQTANEVGELSLTYELSMDGVPVLGYGLKVVVDMGRPPFNDYVIGNLPENWKLENKITISAEQAKVSSGGSPVSATLVVFNPKVLHLGCNDQNWFAYQVKYEKGDFFYRLIDAETGQVMASAPSVLAE